ncbi:hypothetical protein BGZ58_001263 [Dissophora ornata]|nr:hypothetical protein BGZ58_001263 [Dissophora ornata]
MATETVIYVSLALVLLTRIYVFINPPEFLEEHKDRRYHEYHLYRQYHIHKQTDKNEQQEDQHESGLFMPSSSRRRSDADRESSMSMLDGLHYSSDELVLLGREPGARPFPLRELLTLDPAPVTSPTSSSPFSPRESERGIWHHILGSSGANPVPNYISLDISEIHYNGSLKKFDRDSEVLESIRELKAGLRDMAKECPTMTMIWEGGRWCCLEGRTLYILRALEWKGQVRVRVLVDKDPMTLAVTEDYWKATGMAPELNMSSDATSFFSQSGMMPISPISPLVSPTDETYFGKQARKAEWEANIDAGRHEDHNKNKNKNNNHIQTSAATAEKGAVTVGLSLDDDRAEDMGYIAGRRGAAISSQLRSSLLTSAEPSLPGSPAGHEADDEDEEDDDEAASDGYMEDDEDEEDEEDEVAELKRRLEVLDMGRKPSRPQLAAFPRRRESAGANGGSKTVHSKSSGLIWPAMPQQQQQHQQQRPPILVEEDENNSDLTVVSPPSPLLLPSPNLNMLHPYITKTTTTTRSQKYSFETDLTMNTNIQHQHQLLRQHHERKVSIPEFMLPPPLHDEQPYVIVDPTSPDAVAGNLRENTFRRDSGHGDSP